MANPSITSVSAGRPSRTKALADRGQEFLDLLKQLKWSDREIAKRLATKEENVTKLREGEILPSRRTVKTLKEAAAAEPRRLAFVKLVEDAGLRDREVADLIDVSRNYVNMIRHKSASPKASLLNLLKLKLAEEYRDRSKLAAIESELKSPDERRIRLMIKRVQELPKESRERALKVIEGVVETFRDGST